MNFNKLFGRYKMVDCPVQQEFRTRRIAPNLPRKHYLSAASVVLNEVKYIQQWIEFHRLVGFEHFTIYENGSTDGTREILRQYSDIGLVDVVPWPHFLPDYDTQALAWAHALSHAGPQTRWLAFFDIDEYIHAPGRDTVADLLREHEDLPAIVMYWLMFGTSDHKTPPGGLLIEDYTKRAPIPTHPVKDPLLANYKTVVQPERILSNRGSHNFYTDIDNCNGFDEDGRRIFRKEPRKVVTDRIRINHYYTKSLAEWEMRFNRRQVSNTIKRDQFLKEAFKKIEENQIEDNEILRYALRLRAALAQPACIAKDSS